MRLTTALALGLFLAGCRKGSPESHAFQDGQAEAARVLTPQMLAKYVEYERALGQGFWQRAAFSFEAELIRNGHPPKVPGTFAERRDVYLASHRAAAAKAGLTEAEAMNLWSLSTPYYQGRIRVDLNEQVFPRLEADLARRRLDGGVNPKHEAMFAADRAEDLKLREKLAAFEAKFGKPVTQILDTQKAAIEELWTHPPPINPALRPILEASGAPIPPP